MISIHYDADHLGDEKKYWKDFEPVNFAGDVESMAYAMARFAWSPIQWWDGGRRRESSFARAEYCVLDYDDGLTTLDQARRMFADCVHVIGTTRSHQKPKGDRPPCDRFRVALRFERPIENLAEFKANMRFWIGRFGSDDQCVDGARFYWPCHDIVSVSDSGETLEVVPPPEPPKPRDFSAYREMKAVPPWARGVLINGAPAGKRNTTCYRLGIYLSQCGFDLEEIVELILRSPIKIGEDEIRRAVANGVKTGHLIMAEQQANV